ncbi:MAG: hypothetical protein RRY29_09055 [Desulfovibrionaceae bacterium]
MGNYLCEMFGHFIYAARLSYQELLKREAMLTRDTEELLHGFQAEHLNYTPLGDELMLQCVFKKYNPELFEEICDGLHPLLCQAVQGRLLFVDKHLNSLLIYSLTEQGWHEAPLRIPSVEESTRIVEPNILPRMKKNKSHNNI